MEVKQLFTDRVFRAAGKSFIPLLGVYTMSILAIADINFFT